MSFTRNDQQSIAVEIARVFQRLAVNAAMMNRAAQSIAADGEIRAGQFKSAIQSVQHIIQQRGPATAGSLALR